MSDDSIAAQAAAKAAPIPQENSTNDPARAPDYIATVGFSLPPPTYAHDMMAVFAGNEGAHGTHGEPVQDGLKWAIKTTARTIREPVIIELWEQHLSGRRPLGVIPIREDSTCLWGSIDIDIYDEDLTGIVTKIETAKLPLVPCRSKSGGLHLFLFLKQPMQADTVQATLETMAVELGCSGAEIFPKQTRLDEARGDVGNWMVMPYFGSTYGGRLREQVGVKKTGSEMTIAEFLRHAQKLRCSPGEFDLLGKRTRERRQATRPEADVSFSDGPPCLLAMAANGVEENAGRNNALFHSGVYARKKWPSDWERKLEEINQKVMRPPLLADEVLGIVRSLRKKDYGYKCNDQPMCALCDRSTCLTRQYGVGESLPAIVSWRKLNSDEPVWFVTIEGSNREIELNEITDLTNYKKFADQCAKQLDRFLPAMKQDIWAAMLQARERDLEVEEPPRDTTPEGVFQELLEDFLVNRYRGQSRNDILRGKPWEDMDAARHYFRMQDLHKYVVVNGMKHVTRNECGKWIKRLGGGRNEPNPTTIKGKSVRLWWVPSSAVEATPVLDLPPLPTERL